MTHNIIDISPIRTIGMQCRGAPNISACLSIFPSFHQRHFPAHLPSFLQLQVLSYLTPWRPSLCHHGSLDTPCGRHPLCHHPASARSRLGPRATNVHRTRPHLRLLEPIILLSPTCGRYVGRLERKEKQGGVAVSRRYGRLFEGFRLEALERERVMISVICEDASRTDETVRRHPWMPSGYRNVVS
jgi:hypothetical protein